MASDIRGLADAAVDTLTSLPYEAWHFGDSVAFEAGVMAGDVLNRVDVKGFMRGFARGWAATRDRFVEMDATAPGRALVHLAEESGDSLLRETTLDLAHYLTQRPKIAGVYQTWARSPLRNPYGHEQMTPEDERLLADPGPGVFVDCLHFDPPFFAALYRATDDNRWADEALTQALSYVSMLQDPDTGLLWHFHLAHSRREHMLGWGRGQGWALLGLLDVIADLGSERAGALMEPARRLIEAMLRRQLPDGSWDAVAGVGESGKETSTAAFMAHAFRRACDLRVVSPDTVNDSIRRALAVTIQNTGSTGVLEGVSVAVWASTVDSHYHHVPTGPVTPWGQGPLVLALLDEVQAENL